VPGRALSFERFGGEDIICRWQAEEAASCVAQVAETELFPQLLIRVAHTGMPRFLNPHHVNAPYSGVIVSPPSSAVLHARI